MEIYGLLFEMCWLSLVSNPKASEIRSLPPYIYIYLFILTKKISNRNIQIQHFENERRVVVCDPTIIPTSIIVIKKRNRQRDNHH